MQNLRIKYPETDKTKYPEATQTCYYQLTFRCIDSTNHVYTVTVTKLPQKPSDETYTLLNINDFGNGGPI